MVITIYDMNPTEEELDKLFIVPYKNVEEYLESIYCSPLRTEYS